MHVVTKSIVSNSNYNSEAEWCLLTFKQNQIISESYYEIQMNFGSFYVSVY